MRVRCSECDGRHPSGKQAPLSVISAYRSTGIWRWGRFFTCPNCGGKGFMIHDADVQGLARALWDNVWDQGRWAALEDRLTELGEVDLARAARDVRGFASVQKPARSPGIVTSLEHEAGHRTVPDGADHLLWLVGGRRAEPEKPKDVRPKTKPRYTPEQDDLEYDVI